MNNREGTSLLKKLIYILGFFYLALHLLFFIFQRKILFPSSEVNSEKTKNPIQEIQIANRSTIYLLFSHIPNSQYIVLHFHGNGESVSDTEGLADFYKKMGVSFVAMEYAGYGLAAKDKISEKKLYEDAEQSLLYLKTKFPNQHILLEGQSVGTGIAVELAKRGYGEKLILFSPYTSVAKLAKTHYPWLIFLPYLVLDRFENYDKAQKIKIPTLIVHGTEDTLVPFSMGELIHAQMKTSQLLALEHAGHNDMFYFAADLIFSEIKKFILGG